MIMAGLHFMDRIPFHTVYLTGTVRDTKHVRMSKSLGNGIDPLEVVRRFGADALRFAILSGAAVGTDIVLDPGDLDTSFASGRNFANKLWNAGRLLLSALGDGPRARPAELAPERLSLADRWILSRLATVVRETTEHLEKFRLNDAVGTPYHFLWDDFADWYLEAIKPRLRGDAPGGDVARAVAAHVFDAALRLLHPAMPFITEELYRRLPGRAEASIVVAPWPGAEAGRDDPEAERDFAFVQAAVDAVRGIRADYGVKLGQRIPAAVGHAPAWARDALERERHMVERLAQLSSLGAGDGATGPGAHALLPGGADLFVRLGDVIDVTRECARLGTELSRLEGQLAALRAKLGNDGFRSRAPADVVAREEEKERQWSAKRDAIAAKRAALGCA
jgi:valyl-tRNA synthetase